MEVNFRLTPIFLMLKKSKSFRHLYVHNSGPSFKTTGGSGKLVKKVRYISFQNKFGKYEIYSVNILFMLLDKGHYLEKPYFKAYKYIMQIFRSRV